MLKFKHFYFLIILFCSISYSQVTNTITELKVNNVTSSNINFGVNSSVNLTFKVKLKTFDGQFDNILGNLFIYTKKNSTDIEYQQDFSSVTFTVTHPPFVTQTTYDSEIIFDITLQANQFYANGGVLYAEYKNNNNQKYKSANVTIVGGTLVTDTDPVDPDPSPIDSPYLKLLNIRYTETGEEVQDNEVLIPVNKESITISVDYEFRNYPGITSFTLCGDRFYYQRKRYPNPQSPADLLSEGVLISFPSSPCPEFSGVITGSFPSMTISKEDFSNGEFLIFTHADRLTNSRGYGIESTKLKFKVIDFVGNTIFTNSSQVYSGSQVSINGEACRAIIGKALDPRTGIMRDVYADADRYEWFKKDPAGDWEIIDGAELASYMETIYSNTLYQRRSYYKGVWLDSNTIRIDTIIESGSNIICCDQELESGATAVDPIVGNIILNIEPHYYLWQTYQRGEWRNIANSNTKDYTPPISDMTGRQAGQFRRLAVSTTGNHRVYYSNVVTIRNSNSTRGRMLLEESFEVLEEKDIIKIFPNPVTLQLNIQSESRIEALSIYDINGREIVIDNELINDKVAVLDVSILAPGNYFVVIQSQSKKTFHKFIKL